MARKARLRSSNRIYHIVLRGNDRQDVFLDDEDKVKMMQILNEKKQDNAFFLFSFCILHNHIHLILRENEDDVSRILKRAATSFAFYFNNKYGKSGRVFQDRFKSEAIENGHMLLEAIRYVHRNPLKNEIRKLDEYKWSSYQEYLYNAEGITDRKEILTLFSNDEVKALKNFEEFTNMEGKEEFLDIADEKEINNSNAYQYIKKFLNNTALALEDLKKPENKKVRDLVILYLLNSSNLSRRRIAEILGINRETVRKAGLVKDG